MKHTTGSATTPRRGRGRATVLGTLFAVFAIALATSTAVSSPEGRVGGAWSILQSSLQHLQGLVLGAGGASTPAAPAPQPTSPPQYSGIQVTNPAAGQELVGGSQTQIQWTAGDYQGNVRIEFSPDGGQTWVTLAENTSSFGPFDWTVPTTAGAGLIRVTLLTNPDVQGLSGPFTIVNYPYLVSGTVSLGGAGLNGVNMTLTGPDPLTFTQTVTPNVAIPDGNSAGVYVPINVPNPGYVQSVSVGTTITHPDNRDLHVYLVPPAPSGESSSYQHSAEVFDGFDPPPGFPRQNVNTFFPDPTPAPGLDIQNNSQWLNDYPTKGPWNLHVIDYDKGDAGTLDSWTLNINYYPWAGGPGQWDTQTGPLAPLQIIAPAAGQTLLSGHDGDVIWAPGDVTGNVKIEWRSSPTSAWQVVHASMPNSGSAWWQVPNVTTSAAQVRVTSLSDPSKQSVSQWFSIQGAGTQMPAPPRTAAAAPAGGGTPAAAGRAVTAAGAYQFNAAAGTYTVTPNRPGYTFTPASRKVTVGPNNATGVNFVATALPVFNVSGKVAKEGGAGIANARVEAWAAAPEPIRRASTGATPIPNNQPNGIEVPITVDQTGMLTGVHVATDISYSSSGYLEVWVVHPDGTRVLLSDNSWSTLVTTFPDSRQPAEPLSILEGRPASGTWKLVVADTYGYTSSGGNVNSWRLILDYVTLERQILTASTGTYTFTGLPQGAHAIRAAHPNFTFRPPLRAVNLGPNAAGVDFLANPLYSISGTVRDGTRGMGGVTVQIGGDTTSVLNQASLGPVEIQDSGNPAAESTINVEEQGLLTAVHVGVDITHPYIGDLRVALVHPDGTQVLLQNQSGGDDRDLNTLFPDQTLPVQDLRMLNGKRMDGEWTLVVQDLDSGDTGVLNGWSLRLEFGQGGNVTTAANGTYILHNLSAGHYEVSASLAGAWFDPGFRSVTLGPSATGVDFVRSRLIVTKANGGEIWPVDSTQAITWSKAGVPGNVKIDLSRDGGSTFETILENTPNDGTQTWKVTGPAAARARIRVSAVDADWINDLSDADFNIAKVYDIAGRVTQGAAGKAGVVVTAKGSIPLSYPFAAAPAANIPDNSATGVESTLVVTQTGILDGVHAGVRLTHPDLSQVVVTLTHPDGTAVRLFDRAPGSNLNTTYPDASAPFESLAALNGKPANGTWRLRVRDLAEGATGVLEGWSLVLDLPVTLQKTATTGSTGAYSITGLAQADYTVWPTLTGSNFTPVRRPVSLGPSRTGVDFATIPSTLFSIGGTVKQGSVGLPDVTVLARGTPGLTASATASPALPIPPGEESTAGVETVLPIADVGTLLGVHVAVNISHESFYYVQVILVHPDGTEVLLHNQGWVSGGSDGAVLDTTYPDETTPSQSLDVLKGKPTEGSWKVRVRNVSSWNTYTGTFNGCTLTLDYAKSATTNASGAYQIPGLAAGNYTVWPEAEGFSFTPPTRDVTLGPSTSTAHFVAAPLGIRVTAPTADARWAIGSQQTIRWTSTGITGNVAIDISRNGGGYFNTLVGDTANDGWEQWTVTGDATNDAVIRVRSLAVPGVAGSSGEFVIHAPFSIAGKVTLGTAGVAGATVRAEGAFPAQVRTTSEVRTPIVDGLAAGTESPLAVPDTVVINGVHVVVNASHGYSSDVEITLVHPDGTTVRLHNRNWNSLQTTYPDNTTPAESLAVLRGKPANGTWKLLLKDIDKDNTAGVLNSWTLVIDHLVGETYTATTGADGRYTIAAVGPGTYVVSPAKAGSVFSPASRSVTVGPNAAGVDFAAAASASIRGSVSTGSAGVPGVLVTAYGPAQATIAQSAAPGAAIPDNNNNGVRSSLPVAQTGIVTGVHVKVDVTHPFISDLRVALVHPDGTTVLLHGGTGGSTANLHKIYPDNTAPAQSLDVLKGKSTEGVWQLLAVDGARGDSGVLDAWTLTLNFIPGKSATTAANGSYTIADLWPGTYTVVPRSPDGQFTPDSRTAVLPPSRTGVNFVITKRTADLMIKKEAEEDAAFAIPGVMQSTPAGDQVEEQPAWAGTPAVYHVRVVNRGSTAGTLVLKATEGAGAGWTITYKAGATNISTAIRGTSGYATASLSPGAGTTITVILTPGKAVGGTTTKSVVVASRLSATDSVVRDAVEAKATAGAVVQPDLLIRATAEADTAYAINNQYQLVPSGLQRRQLALAAGKSASYTVKLENDGNVKKCFVLRGSESAAPGWTLAYKVGATDISAQVRSTHGYQTAELLPNASVVVAVVMTPSASAERGSTKSTVLRAFLYGSTQVLDAVQATASLAQAGPDLLIKKLTEADTAFTLDNVYQPAPAGAQFRRVTTNPTTAAAFVVRLQNDHTTARTYVLKAAESLEAGWGVVYKVGSADITPAITGPDGYTTTSIAAGAAVAVNVTLTPASTVQGGTSKSTIVRVFLSGTDAVVRDSVQAKVTVLGAGVQAARALAPASLSALPVPELLAPADGAAVSATPELSLTAGAAGEEPVRFEIELAQGGSAWSVETDAVPAGAAASFAVPVEQPLAAGAWRWRARVLADDGAAGEWSEGRAFAVR